MVANDEPVTASTQFPARAPYHGNVMVDPSKSILFISSNGFEATRDLVNRASIFRVNKREGHQFRSHDGKDALQMTFELQPVWYGAVIKIIEEWDEQGRPTTNETRHDTREWCQTLDWIVQNIFHAAPLSGDARPGAQGGGRGRRLEEDEPLPGPCAPCVTEVGTGGAPIAAAGVDCQRGRH
jgi:hypothetical protein